MNINVTIDGVSYAPSNGASQSNGASRELKVLFEQARKLIRMSEAGDRIGPKHRNGLRRALKGVKAQHPRGTFPANCA